MNIKIKSVREYIYPINVDSKDAKVLNVAEGEPAFLIVRIARVSNDEWIEFRRVIIKSNKCRFEIKIL